MGRRGTKPLPTAEKAARGTLRKCRTNPDEPQLAAPRSTDPPSDLKGRGLAHWNRHIKEQVEKGVLRDVDLATFEMWCRRLTDLEGYERLASKNRELAIAKGYANMVIKLTAACKQLAAECGGTPSSRSGVKAVEKKEPGKLEQFLRRVK